MGGGRLRLVPAGRAARAGATTAGGASVEDHTPWRTEGRKGEKGGQHLITDFGTKKYQWRRRLCIKPLTPRTVVGKNELCRWHENAYLIGCDKVGKLHCVLDLG